MLTTVRQPLQEMGRMAVTLLIRLLDGTGSTHCTSNSRPS